MSAPDATAPDAPRSSSRGLRASRLGVVLLAALLGVAVAATIAYAASRLVSQPIGLSAEPADLGRSLAPAPARDAAPVMTTRGAGQQTSTRKAPQSTAPQSTAPQTTAPQTTAPQASPGAPASTPTTTSGDDDSAGSGSDDRGSHREPDADD